MHWWCKMNKLYLFLVVFVALSLLAGCNKPADNSGAPAATSTPPAQQEAPTAAASNGDAEAMTAAEHGDAPVAAAGEEAPTAEAADGDEAAPDDGSGEAVEPGADGEEGAVANGEGEEAAAPEAEPEVSADGDEGEAVAEGETDDKPSAAEATDNEEAGAEAMEVPAPEDAGDTGSEVVEAADGDEVADTPADAEGEGSEDAEAEMEEEAEPATPIDQFKSLDPREIIDRKYEDLQEQHTKPWDEEDPEQFIPDTGRVDPLTRVREAVPEELKPPRAGETDENDITSYFVAQDATIICYSIAYAMECYNVIQIGIEKQATVSVFGNTFLMSEGQSAGPINVGQSSGIPLSATLVCTSISESEVHITVTVSGDGTSTSISKSMVFIPKSWI